MKIIHAITRLDKGGSSTNTLLSASGLAEKGYEVDLLYGKTNGADDALMRKAKGNGVNFIEESSLLRDIHPGADLKALFNIFLILRKGKYDVLHAHTSKAGLICRIAGKLAGIRNIVYTPHGHVFYGYFNRGMTRVIVLVETLLAFITNKIIGLTSSECEEWISFGVGEKGQYESVASGVDFDYLDSLVVDVSSMRGRLKIPKDKILIGSVGRFVEVKGYKFFIEAAIEQLKKRDNVVFILVGSGELKEKYVRMISEAKVSNRFFIIPWQDNPAGIINAMDIFVLSSINEGMGRVLVEAMYFEKPVIASCVGGVPGLVSDREGILVKAGSSVLLSKAIDELFEKSNSWSSLGSSAKAKVIKQYSAKVMVDKLDVLYKEISG